MTWVMIAIQKPYLNQNSFETKYKINCFHFWATLTSVRENVISNLRLWAFFGPFCIFGLQSINIFAQKIWVI